MAAERGMQPLLEALAEPALVVDTGMVRLANAAARNLFGPNIAGSDVRLVVRHPQALDQLLEGRAGDLDVSGIGELERPWTMSVRSLDEDALLVRLIDRTATVAAERMRVDFVANASHELRTPLSTILGYAETIAEDPDLNPRLRMSFAGTIRAEARRMLALIEDLMNLSRIEAGRFVAPTDLVDIEEIAKEAVGNLKVVEGCRIETEFAGSLPKFRGDRAQLLQLMDNLLSNAVRYGCVSEDRLIRVSGRAERGWIVLSVADNGPGIPPEHLPRITERFYRVDAARSRESGGTGLGLAIVKHIVERHRGTLEIRSTPGRGTDVIVHFPVPPPQAAVTSL